jgi:hypothetical protein
LLRNRLVHFVSESAALEIPAAVLVRIIDFNAYEGRSDEYEHLFRFCIDYLKTRGSSALQILRTLSVNRLSNDDLGRLCSLDELNWGVLNGSVCWSLISMRDELSRSRIEADDLRIQVTQHQREVAELRNQVREQQREIGNLQNEVGRRQKKNWDLKAGNIEQRRKTGTLEGERSRLEGMIAKQESEMESLEAKKRDQRTHERATFASWKKRTRH